nr:hypothetical protein [Tanacetum cinerariifolium]
LHVFGALCYPKNDREDIGKLGAKDNVPIPTNSSSHATNIPITSQDVDELNPNDMVDGNTFVNPFATSSSNAADTSSSQNVDPSNMHMFYQPYRHEFQWTKDHPLEQVIREPLQPVLTRNQLRSDGDMIFLAYAAHKSFTVFQMDVKTAFLHGSLKEDVLKKDQEKDKIRSNPDKNGKRGEAGKSLKQLQ